jgi:hypothetical protein
MLGHSAWLWLADPRVHGLLIQLPLPAHLNQKRVLSFVSAAKDVDGLHPENMGLLVRLGEELRQAKKPFTVEEVRTLSQCRMLCAIAFIHAVACCSFAMRHARRRAALKCLIKLV